MNQKAKKLLSIIMSIFMVLGCFTSNVFGINEIFGESFADNPHFIQTNDFHQSALMKIEPAVSKDLENEEFVDIMVYMNSQVDTEKVAYETQRSLSRIYVTPYQQNMIVRRNVVEALKSNAQTTQAKVIEYLQKEISKGNVKELESFFSVNMIHIKATKEVVEKLSYMSEVGEIQKNNTIQLDIMEQSNIEPSNSNVEWSVSRVGADATWDLGYDGTGVVVANIDSGVQWDHPALKNKWRAYDPVTGAIENPEASWFDAIGGERLPIDSDNHGTHVMGTIVGGEEDGSNKIGVAPGAKWIAARVFNSAGSTNDAVLLSAGDWILAPGGNPDNAPDIVNNSWGGGEGIRDWYRDVVRAWRAAGIVPVFSAGNQQEGEPAPWPGSISVPSNYPESFAVAATDKNNKLGSFSKLGPSPYDENLIKPDIAAPGVSVRSSVPGNEYISMQGTSMAAPSVAGVAALIKSANQSLTVDQIEQLIKETATPLTDDKFPTSPNMGYGYGLANAYEAVSKIAGGTGFISGTVLAAGEDNPGNIVHNQKIHEVYLGLISEIEILADVTDDVAITSVDLLVKKENESFWTEIPMDKLSGDHKEAKYSGIITSDMLEVDNSVIYKIKVKDYSGNVVTTKDYRIDVKMGVTPNEYVEDFEGDVSSWRFSGTTAWEIGVPSVGPTARSGMKVAATALNSLYPNSADSYLISPPIDLRDESLVTASLRYYQWYNTETNWDNGYILASNDGGESWKQLGSMVTGTQKEWKEAHVNLNEFIGSEEPVYVAFRFTSDGSNGYDGWYIDDVSIVGKDDDAPVSPSNLTLSTGPRGINLSWNASAEVDLSHYNVYRSLTAEGEFTKITQTNTNRFLDSSAVDGQTYYYKISAVDFSQNESDLTEEEFATAFDIDIIWGTDFEDDDGGFVEEGERNLWQWGIPTTGPKAAFSGERLWATNLSGTYFANADNSITTSDAITLEEGRNPMLLFTHWIYMQGTTTAVRDYGQVQISTDNGDTWENITPESGENVIGGKYTATLRAWSYESISLENYVGQDIKIRFYFHSDDSTNRDGWYIDDLYILDILSEGDSSDSESEIYTIDDSEYLEYYDYTESDIEKGDYVEPSAADIKINKLVSSQITDKDYNKISDADVQNMPMAITNIPVADAVITIVETGRSIKVNPATGEYVMRVKAGENTIRVDAYGYRSSISTLEVNENEVSVANFILEEKDRGTITGIVRDRFFEEPIANATVSIIEDSKIPSVKTNENGEFVFNDIFEGSYTLRVVANGYESGEISVNVIEGGISETEIELKRFVSYDDEIIYDDGTAENALILNSAGNGLAVRFTPRQYGKVKGANVYFWHKSTGTNMGFVIYRTANGVPYQVGEPIFMDIVRGEWNYIDLSSFGFATGEDFYISTIQSSDSSISPATGFDNNSEHSDRSYLNIGGKFSLIKEEDKTFLGSLMIRAKMEYEMSTPVITNLSPEINYVNQDTIIVEGRLTVDGKVNVYVNDSEPVVVDSINNVFSAEVNLTDIENTIKVSATLDGRETEPSETRTVIKDKVAPTLLVTSPELDSRYNVEVVHVAGNVADDIALSKLEINGVEVKLNENGDFHERLILPEGESTITVEAMDKAGNITIIERTVTVKLGEPEITNITPNTNVELRAGEKLTVSFTASPGGRGYFRVLMPYGAFSLDSNDLGIEMTETNGTYTGEWTIPTELAVTGLKVQIVYEDQYGVSVTKIAEGKVTVIGKIVDMAANTVIVGEEAFDIDFLNNNARAQIKLIEYFNSNDNIYIKIDRNTVVTTDGVLVTIEDLENFITYYDVNGNVLYFEK